MFSSCKAVILSCSDLTFSPVAFELSPADSFTTSCGPFAGIDLSSAALLILPPEDCVLPDSDSAGLLSSTIPANLFRYAFQLAVCTLISRAASLRDIAFNVSSEGWRIICPTFSLFIFLP